MEIGCCFSIFDCIRSEKCQGRWELEKRRLVVTWTLRSFRFQHLVGRRNAILHFVAAAANNGETSALESTCEHLLCSRSRNVLLCRLSCASAQCECAHASKLTVINKLQIQFFGTRVARQTLWIDENIAIHFSASDIINATRDKRANRQAKYVVFCCFSFFRWKNNKQCVVEWLLPACACGMTHSATTSSSV